MKKFISYLLIILPLIGLWEFCAQNYPSFGFICPPPSKVLTTGIHSFPVLFQHSCYTAQGILGGFFLALLLAILFSATMLLFPSTQGLLHPLCVLVQCLPMFTLAPLIVLWFGWGTRAVIIPTALSIFFPLALTIHQGIKNSPEELLEQFTLYQATTWQKLFKLRIPNGLPHIFSGLKIAMSAAGFATIAGEWVATQSGLGILILESRRNYDMAMALAGLFVLTMLTLSLFYSVLLLERSTFFFFRMEKTSKRSFGKKWVFALIPITVLPCLFYLKDDPKLAAPVPTKSFTLLLDWTPNPNHIPLYAGVEKGFFVDEGISLTLQKNTDTCSSIPHLLLEKVDYTLYHSLGVLKTAVRGAPVQVAGRLIDSSLQGLIYRKNEGIEKLEDLNGRVLGFCLNDSKNLPNLLEALRKHHVVPSEIKNVSADMISPMLTYQIDFLYGGFYNVEGVTIALKGTPTGCFLSDTYGSPTGPQLLICGKKGSPAMTPQTLQSLQKALSRSLDFCREYPQEAFAIYVEATKDSPKVLSDERAQWEVTLPLLAKTQEPLSRELLESLLVTLSTTCPDLRTSIDTFSIETLISDVSETIASS
ncbi:ABC transporter permease/substrate-binding protein [Chlamydia trachomatis]|uniref:ABC transporter permease fused to pyrimidine biosynthesis enzyme n=1 Tax=Chlamydia trachomatis serovar D (strain ATCC VR-885 / DSM 19411 / UW-3/Cx) TaxID=272561 RepID=O84862_CHLTR|nr:ABC transporter permease/substrate-binding protein [Chlamydia trachomatis]NP_220376.1 ABC transporter permease/substrate-binding protein [Chlamydia trachomatis D/UW-3/CX]AAC68451.1 ABC transporter permease fused to pyrimidine biosynthesis enzyme [Chlamydia trachomatis D/UW-3/CX]ADI51527.1 ABC transporter permease protein [Chlamydia trachomatis D-EC]ADI52539.1 ABC transporter permease protein [Chlamydia trachomatis D-LC]AGT70380.1 ABC transporter permease [Chlamydia trachomatis]UFT28093.1 A